MSNLTVIEHSGVLVTDSREVARMVEKRHDNLVRNIDGYIEILENSELRNGLKLDSKDFFIPSEYESGNPPRMYRNFWVTKKGCDMIANKMTGEKGVLFTATYVNDFEAMKEIISQRKVVSLSDYKGREVDAKYNNSVARLNKSLAEKAKVLKDIANDPTTPETYRQVLNSKAAEIVAEQMILPLPETEKTYTATDIGLEAGVSANKIGRIANEIGAKNNIDAVLVWDKSPFSAKQVSTWRYRESGKRKILDALYAEQERIEN